MTGPHIAFLVIAYLIALPFIGARIGRRLRHNQPPTTPKGDR